MSTISLRYPLDAGHRLLLEAALYSDARASRAWANWVERSQWLERDVDTASYRLLPLVHRNLNKMDPMHADALRLKGVYRRSWAANMQVIQHAIPAVTALNDAGLRPVLIKGAALLSGYYGDTGVRPMSDVDVLVPHETVHAALDLLLAADWTGIFDIDPHAILKTQNGVGLRHPDGGSLDLHHGLLPENAFSDADRRVHTRCVPVRLGAIPSLRLSAADELLLSCAHGWPWNTIPAVRWIADAATIIRTADTELDWDGVVAQARERQLTFRLYCALATLAEDFELQVPTEPLDALAQEPHAWFEAEETEQLARPQKHLSLLTTSTLSCLFKRRHGPLKGPRAWLAWCRFQRDARFAPRGLAVLPWLAKALIRRLAS